VDAFISAETPVSRAVAEVTLTQKTTFEITLSVTPGSREECRDTLPFGCPPLNMGISPQALTVSVNDVSTTFQWPSERRSRQSLP
jgi:hypothetical protein